MTFKESIVGVQKSASTGAKSCFLSIRTSRPWCGDGGDWITWTLVNLLAMRTFCQDSVKIAMSKPELLKKLRKG